MAFLQKVKKFFKNFTPPVEEDFDPSVLHDEVAMKTEWTPLCKGGSNFCTHTLQKSSPNLVEFKARYLALAFPCAFMAIGLGVIASIFSPEAPANKYGILFLVIFGVFFFLGGFFFFYVMKRSSNFDKNIGFYWKGHANSFRGHQITTSQKSCKLDRIHAVQLLRKKCTSDDGSYYSYELNLILKDGQRLNVIDHGKLEQLRADTEILSEFLGVPVWDIVSESAIISD